MSTTPVASSPETDDTASFRAKLGMRLVTWSTISIVTLAAVIMIAAVVSGKPEQVKDTAQLLLTTLLPLFGTWVGTVLAFFYSKENFDAATRNTMAVVRSTTRALAEILVSDTQIAAWNVKALRLAPDRALSAVTVAEMDAAFAEEVDGKKVTRLPVLDAAGVCRAIVHRSIWMEMQVAGTRSNNPLTAPDATIAALLALPRPTTLGATFADLITRSFLTIAPDRSLAEAKSAIERDALYQDLIVTRGGGPEEAMIGWLTNIAIAKASRA